MSKIVNSLRYKPENGSLDITPNSIGCNGLVVPISTGGSTGDTNLTVDNNPLIGFQASLSSSLDNSKVRINLTNKTIWAETADGSSTSTITLNPTIPPQNVWVFKPTDGFNYCVFKVPAKCKMYWLASGTNWEANIENGVITWCDVSAGISNGWISSNNYTYTTDGSGNYLISLPIKQNVVQMYFYFISDLEVQYISSEETFANANTFTYLPNSTHLYKHIINLTNSNEDFYFVLEITNQISSNLALSDVAGYLKNNGFTQDYHYYGGAGSVYTSPSFSTLPVGAYSSDGNNIMLICADNQTSVSATTIELERIIQIM